MCGVCMHVYVCACIFKCVCVCMHTLWHKCRGQRTIWNQFSPSIFFLFLWVQGIELGSSGLHGGIFHQLSHLTCLRCRILFDKLQLIGCSSLMTYKTMKTELLGQFWDNFLASNSWSSCLNYNGKMLDKHLMSSLNCSFIDSLMMLTLIMT